MKEPPLMVNNPVNLVTIKLLKLVKQCYIYIVIIELYTIQKKIKGLKIKAIQRYYLEKIIEFLFKGWKMYGMDSKLKLGEQLKKFRTI